MEEDLLNYLKCITLIQVGCVNDCEVKLSHTKKDEYIVEGNGNISAQVLLLAYFYICVKRQLDDLNMDMFKSLVEIVERASEYEK